MAKRRRPPEYATHEEKIKFVSFLAGVVEAIFDQMDIPPTVGIAAALLVATDAARRSTPDIRQGAIETLEQLLDMLKRETPPVLAPEPVQKM